MRNRTRTLLRIVAPLIATGMIVATVGRALADEIEQLKLVVNIVQGSALTKEDAQEVAKAVDDILKQCDKYGIRMRVTPEIKTGVTKIDGLDPVPSENVTRAQQEEIVKAGEKEVSGGGYKMTVVEGFEDDNDNGGTVRGHPSSVVDEWASADTWGHEIGHGLGLPHSDDKGNLMHGVKSDRTGTGLTEAQCRDMKNNFKLRGAEKRCSEGQQQSGQCQPATESVDNATYDPAGDTANPTVDVEAMLCTFDLHPVTPSLLTATRVGLFPGSPVSVAYEIGFDTDDNIETGGVFGPFGPGFDFKAVVQAAGVFPFEGTATAVFVDLPEGTEVMPLDPEFVPLFLHVDVEVPPEVPDEEINAELLLAIPVEALAPLANPMRVAATAASGPDLDLVEPFELLSLPAALPELVVTPRTAYPSQLLNIEGSGYAPLSELTLLLGNEVLAETVTLGDGTFSTDASTPALPADHYLLDAIDGEGAFGLEVVTITAPVGGMADLPQEDASSGANRIALIAVLAATAFVGLVAVAYVIKRGLRRET